MNLTQNTAEALRATRDNWLRSLLTISLIAIGITALVGILTAIDGIEQNITSGLSDLGANSFDIRDKNNNMRSRRRGVVEKIEAPLKYNEVMEFDRRFRQSVSLEDAVTVYTRVSFGTEVKYQSEKTNPNSSVVGIDQNYNLVKGFDIKEGRNFAPLDIQRGSQFAIIGKEIKETLFKDISPIGKRILLKGYGFTVIGLLEEQGGIGSSSSTDRSVLIPLPMANILGNDRQLSYTITVGVKNPAQKDALMGEATGLMRIIRGDKLTQKPSFEVSSSESLASSLGETTVMLRIGGAGIGFLTLLGASIGLMNIMLVSVTERTREIGIRKAIGASAKHIREQFIIEAIVICLLGGFFGIFLGITLGNGVAKLLGDANSEFVIPWLWMITGIIICILVGLAAGVYPAYKASKLDPIESLRYE
ncbi:ABC transporter permease [Bernardetia sp.]|uniref:ABC transporter permease n=1 Tax=Bernardetia sp. TaxID=1937974 RepID=UPI0025BFF248|nr:ABC transporter permease [Bernardetia sp.]